eukprot:snap_masked-scaffold_14-processed-gene-2.47-mRNA-1 protein AED:0.12 eAED:0.50 QI:0/-1/0/1/-1/1/1/0/356
MATAEELYTESLELATESSYTKAIEKLLQAVELSPLPKYHYKLASFYLKNKQPDEAITYITLALAEHPENEMYSLLLAQAHFSMADYSSVVDILKTHESKEAKTLSRKAQAELDADSDSDEESEEEEELVVEEVTNRNVQENPASFVNTMELEDLEEASIFSYKFDYYQSSQYVTISFVAKGMSQEDVSVNFENKSFTIALRGESKRIKLFSEIIPEESSYVIRKTKVEVKLKKYFQDLQWLSLEAQINAQSLYEQERARSAYSSKKNWDKVEKLLAKAEENEKPEGDEALNKLFQDIYSKASDETRRAMNKSFQTSGGTVLSTSWDEVAKKDYEKERTAPDGMEWKDWEGDKIKS